MSVKQTLRINMKQKGLTLLLCSLKSRKRKEIAPLSLHVLEELLRTTTPELSFFIGLVYFFPLPSTQKVCILSPPPNTFNCHVLFLTIFGHLRFTQMSISVSERGVSLSQEKYDKKFQTYCWTIFLLTKHNNILGEYPKI